MKFVRYWLPLFFYMSLIFFLSSLSMISLPESDLISIDKFYHTIEYGVLCYLTLRAFRNSSRKILNEHAFFYAFIVTSIYGASDEVHQIFVPGREASVFDWVADVLGAFLVVVGTLYFHKRRAQKG